MKSIVCLAACCALAFFASAACAEEGRFGLRVIADNDSDQAQTRKHAVRDAVLTALWPRFLECASDSERERLLFAFISEARAIAQGEGDAHAGMNDCAPDGTQCLTLTITLGAGAGRNWFGILCPEVMEGLGEGDTLQWRSKDILRHWLLYNPPAL